MKKLVNILTLTLMLAAVGCGTVMPGGVYEGSKPVYVAESSYNASFKILNAFMEWETANGDALWKLNPEIKKKADVIRLSAPLAFLAYDNAMDKFLLAPTKDNRTLLMVALEEIEKNVIAAQTITLEYK